MVNSIFPVPDWDDDGYDVGTSHNSTPQSISKKQKKQHVGEVKLAVRTAKLNGGDVGPTTTKDGKNKVKRKLEASGQQIEIDVVKKKKIDPGQRVTGSELAAKLSVKCPTVALKKAGSAKLVKLKKKTANAGPSSDTAIVGKPSMKKLPAQHNASDSSDVVKRKKKKLSIDKPLKKLPAVPHDLHRNVESVKVKKKKKNLEKSITTTGKAPVKVLKLPGSDKLVKIKLKKKNVENGLIGKTTVVSKAQATHTIDADQLSKTKKKKKKLEHDFTDSNRGKLPEKILNHPKTKIQLAKTKNEKLDVGEQTKAASTIIKASSNLSRPGPSKAAGNVLREKLVERLKGSRFRFINEQLYRTNGEEALKLFQEDPNAFHAYHEGYRHQLEQWSMNPLDRIIKSILKLPKQYVIADFGCGEARLAKSVPHLVYSLDLFAANDSVIACDMANTPLESNFVHVVVFCLSLMGTNLQDFLIEANRVLKAGGLLKIAEVSSRFDNIKEFVANVQSCGFSLEVKDYKNKLFYFFHFKKARTVSKATVPRFSLKPCLYKKR